MAKLKTEYTDVKNLTHKVEHIVLPSEDSDSKERISQELYIALTKRSKRRPA